MKFNIEFYATEDGRQPFCDFYSNLDKQTKAKVLGAIELLKEYGTELRAPVTKAIGEGLFELRVKYEKIQIRNIFFFFSGKKIIVTNGFIKKTQKLPLKQKKMALKYKKDWIRRFGK